MECHISQHHVCVSGGTPTCMNIYGYQVTSMEYHRWFRNLFQKTQIRNSYSWVSVLEECGTFMGNDISTVVRHKICKYSDLWASPTATPTFLYFVSVLGFRIADSLRRLGASSVWVRHSRMVLWQICGSPTNVSMYIHVFPWIP